MTIRQTQKSARASTVPTHDLVIPPTVTIAPAQLDDLRASVQMIAATDKEFRTALLHNPRETVAMLVEMNSGGAYELQKGLDVVVLEEGPGATFVVIPSPDKVEGSESELARLSREVAIDPQLREALKRAPAETLQEFAIEHARQLSMLSADHGIKVFCEDAGEILFVIPAAGPTSAASIAAEELLPSGEIVCGSAGTCQCTQQCFGSNGCTWWNNC